MINIFNIILVVTVILVIGFILYVVRKIMRRIKESGLSPDEMRKLAKEIRQRDVSCPRCSRQSSAMFGTDIKYRCDSCNHVFEGPRHIPLP